MLTWFNVEPSQLFGLRSASRVSRRGRRRGDATSCAKVRCVQRFTCTCVHVRRWLGACVWALTADQSQLYSSCNPQGQDTSSNTIQVSALDLLYATTSRKTSVQTRESLPLPRVSPVARAQVVAYRSELSLTGRRDAIYIAVRDITFIH